MTVRIIDSIVHHSQDQNIIWSWLVKLRTENDTFYVIVDLVGTDLLMYSDGEDILLDAWALIREQLIKEDEIYMGEDGDCYLK